MADEVFEVEKGQKKSYQQIQAELKTHTYEFIFVPHQSLRTAFLIRPLKAKMKISFSKWWNFLFFDTRIQKNMSFPDALRQLSLMSVLDEKLNHQLADLSTQNVDMLKMSFAVPEWASMSMRTAITHFAAEKDQLMQKFQITKPFVILFPGSVWNTKKWNIEKFAEVARYFVKQNKQVLLMGSAAESTLCEQIQQVEASALNLAGKSNLFESLLITSDADCVFTNDSGSMHLASVADVPTRAIFGPTVLEIGYRPWQNQARVIENKSLSCRPCGKHGHKVCPLTHHNCMNSIPVKEVIEGL